MSIKPSNPKDSVGVQKVSISAVPAAVLMEVGLGMSEGASKYGRFNFRVIGVRGSVYYDATMRHLAAWWEGEDIDPDTCTVDAQTGQPIKSTGLNHITKAICSLVVLRDAMIQCQFNDDRPPKSPVGWLAELNSKAKGLFDKYQEPVTPYTATSGSGGGNFKGGNAIIQVELRTQDETQDEIIEKWNKKFT